MVKFTLPYARKLIVSLKQVFSFTGAQELCEQRGV